MQEVLNNAIHSFGKLITSNSYYLDGNKNLLVTVQFIFENGKILITANEDDSITVSDVDHLEHGLILLKNNLFKKAEELELGFGWLLKTLIVILMVFN